MPLTKISITLQYKSNCSPHPSYKHITRVSNRQLNSSKRRQKLNPNSCMQGEKVPAKRWQESCELNPPFLHTASRDCAALSRGRIRAEFFPRRTCAPRIECWPVAYHDCGLREKLAEPVTRKISRASPRRGPSGGKVAAAARDCGGAVVHSRLILLLQYRVRRNVLRSRSTQVTHSSMMLGDNFIRAANGLKLYEPFHVFVLQHECVGQINSNS